jgi:hypothetical protein
MGPLLTTRHIDAIERVQMRAARFVTNKYRNTSSVGNMLGTDHLTWRGGYGFLFRSKKKFRTTQEFEYLFSCRAKREKIFHTLTLGYMTKTLNQIIFFLHQNQNIFFKIQIQIQSTERDRPFNLKGGGGLWFFVSFRIFFPDNTRVRIFIFLSGKARIFFQNLTLGYM